MARKDVEQFILEVVAKLDPSGFNTKIYKEKLPKMSKKDYESMIEKFRSGRHSLRLFSPLDSEVELDFDRNVDIAKWLGFDIYQKLTITRGDFVYTPEVEYAVMYMSIRRASQHILKNFNVHKHRKTRNRITGQVAGNSASGRITLQEVQVMKPLGLNNTLDEFLGVRGGDVQASNALNGLLFKNGKVSKSELAPFVTKTQATKTLSAYFKAMHIDISL
jgi:hypothetical protein